MPDKKTESKSDKENPDIALKAKLDKLEAMGYSPSYSGKPIRVYLCAKFSSMVVALDYIDLPIRARAAMYKGNNQYIIDPRNIAFHSHREKRSFIFMDIHT